jgi:2'-5' RNA ligase
VTSGERLFAALVLPPDVVADLTALADRQRGSPLAPAGLRWSAPDRMHLTVVFLGHVDPIRRPGLERRLGRAAARAAPLRLRVSGGGRFGSQVLWAGIAGDVDALRRLARAAVAAARREGLTVEDRRYRPHLTLARSGAGADLRPLAASLAEHSGPAWTADALTLFRSHLGPLPRHEPLAAWPLGAQPGG